jgi:hypothetical protein
MFEEVKLGDYTEENLNEIEKKIQRITGESRMYLEDHWGNPKKYTLMFGSKKCYAANSWNSSIQKIEAYLRGVYKGYKVTANRKDEDCEYEWSVSVYITK